MAEFVEEGPCVVEAREGRRPFEKFMTLTMIGRMSPESLSWLRKALIQAPLRLEDRAK